MLRLIAVVTFLLLLSMPQPDALAQNGGYRLSPGDELHVTVKGEDDLSGPLRVDTGGAVTLALGGAVPVAGLDTTAAADAIAARLRNGYIRHPRVTVALASYRPVYILGGVNHPGEYPYRDGLTVRQAVAMGGGFEHEWYSHAAEITRGQGAAEHTQVYPIDGTVLQPGDVLTINSRWRYHE